MIGPLGGCQFAFAGAN